MEGSEVDPLLTLNDFAFFLGNIKSTESKSDVDQQSMGDSNQGDNITVVSPESSPSLSQPQPQQSPTSPLQPINQICQINLSNFIKPSASSAFSVVPSSSTTASTPITESSSVTNHVSDSAGFIFPTGKDSKFDNVDGNAHIEGSTNEQELLQPSNEPAESITTESQREAISLISENGSDYSSSSNFNNIEISLIYRLTKTTSIWYLPEIGRTGVASLLSNKEDGTFIVRNSSKPNSMALSVRLPQGKGPHVEHYLIENNSDGLLHLEGSENYFTRITSLIAHYCNCCDELPVQLTLPTKLMEANFVKLTSYSLLAQEFWHTLTKCSKPPIGSIIVASNSNNNINSTSSHQLPSSSFVSLSLNNNNVTNQSVTGSTGRSIRTITNNNNINNTSDNNSSHNHSSISTNFTFTSNHQEELIKELQGDLQQKLTVNANNNQSNSCPLSLSSFSSSSSSRSCSPPLTSSSSKFDTDDLIGLNDDPLVDVNKCLTVPITLVTKQSDLNTSNSNNNDNNNSNLKPSFYPPKPPPRSMGNSSTVSVPPPIPSRTSKPSPKSSTTSSSQQSINLSSKSNASEESFISSHSRDNENDSEQGINHVIDFGDAKLNDLVDNYSVNSNINLNNNNLNSQLLQRASDNESFIKNSSQTNEDISTVTSSSGRSENSPKQIESLIKYYNSKVDDKYSDYEDIWSFAPKPNDNVEVVKSQQQQFNNKQMAGPPSVSLSSTQPPPTTPRSVTSKSHHRPTTSTPSDKGSKPFKSKQNFTRSSSNRCSISTQTEPIISSTSSSCDMLADDASNDAMICRPEHLSHYGSDSNLTLSSVRSSRSKHNLSLESLINLNKDASSIYGEITDNETGYCRNTFNSTNPQLGDVSIQVGDGRTSCSSSKHQSRRHRHCHHHHHHRAHRARDFADYATRGSAKDASWLVDSSWKWRRSNTALNQPGESSNVNTDTDDTTLTLRSPLRRNKRSSASNKSDDKRILDQERADLNRYRRFSARYVLESGVESDPETTDNEREESRKSRTVEDLIALEAPELRVPKIETDKPSFQAHIDGDDDDNLDDDNYDNVVTLRKHDKDAATRKANREDSSKTSGGTMTDTETVFSEPWDSEYWRKLINGTPGQTELMMSLSPEEDELMNVDDAVAANANSSSTNLSSLTDFKDRSNIVESLTVGSIIPSTSAQSGISVVKVKREESCKSRIAALTTSFSSYTGDEINLSTPSERESTIDITEVTSFTSDATSDLLSSISMQDQARLSMESDSSTLIGYQTTTKSISGNERIYSAGKSICDYIFKLAEEGDNTFAKSVSHFIDCTKDLHETNPHIVTRNIRQFMNGMKNYLVKHGEKNFLDMIREERDKLKSNEFLNIDAIIEGTLHKLVIKPLKCHLDQLFVEYYKKNGSLAQLSENMKNAQKKSPEELGVRYDLHLPDSKSMAVIQKYFERMQQAYSPLKKLEHLLAAISAIYSGVKSSHQQAVIAAAAAAASKRSFRHHSHPLGYKRPLEHLSIGADDLLPIFIYVLVHCGFLSAEIEAEYMWGLLHPSLLSGEGGYYLTTLSSCLHVLKSMVTENELSTTGNSDDPNVTSATTVLDSSISSSPQSTSPPATPSMTGTGTTSSLATSVTPSRIASEIDLQGYMKIMIPNELSCSIVTKTLPVRPNMTTKDVCKMIAHKFNQTNSEDYGLFQISPDGSEIQLEPSDLPQSIKSEQLKSDRFISFAYKRIDAKFIWPKMNDQ